MEKSKMTVLHTEKFAGDTLTAKRYGPDVEVFINDKQFGVYTSIEAGIKAAKEEIIRRLENVS